ncbi:response regulator [Cohnella nanjingensis]|uniref:Response regulator n=1 Tax=Cohnella nanjingensis TaxID=1387779 RepID=A0A7X0RP90_9BACL|nr:response regulator [Cohnella nanjingensis]MBB6669885.1 response regulator [Cohnella nanjingensis]
MRCMLVDDEDLALKALHQQLSKIDDVEVVGMHQYPQEALEAIVRIRPDVVFLDIDMPEMNGLAAAEKVQDLHPAAEVVFVTAYEEYAVKAFELQALDYILKPLQPERLLRTIGRLSDRLQQKPAPVAAPPMIRCFPSLQIEYGDGKTLPWRTTKAQELFAYLLYRRHQPTRKDTLLDLLWPHTESKKAYTQLYTTIYQLRRSMEAAGLDIRIVNAGNGYALDLGDGIYEAEQWEDRLQQAPPLARDTAEAFEQLLTTYRGDYLEAHDYIWAEGERQRLRGIWFHQAMRFAQYLEDWRGSAEGAVWYHRIQDRFPFAEEVALKLMEAYGAMGENSMVERQYAQLSAMLAEEFGTLPSSRTQAWYREWKNP